MPAAPAPLKTTRRSSLRLPLIFRALIRAASTTQAVPCWSSWKTGRSRRALSVSSISKQAGAAMSSSRMAPKVGAMASTASMTRRRHRGCRPGWGTAADVHHLHEDDALALHDGHGAVDADVAQAEHGGAVGDDGDGVADGGVVIDEGGVGLDHLADLGDAGRVDLPKLGERLQVDAADHAGLAAAVEGQDVFDLGFGFSSFHRDAPGARRTGDRAPAEGPAAHPYNGWGGKAQGEEGRASRRGSTSKGRRRGRLRAPNRPQPPGGSCISQGAGVMVGGAVRESGVPCTARTVAAGRTVRRDPQRARGLRPQAPPGSGSGKESHATVR